MMSSEDSLLNVKPANSNLWKFICKQKNIVEAGIKWQIRNGNSVLFFLDLWLFKNRKIKDLCIRPLTTEEEESRVSDWVLYGAWDLVRLASIVNGEVIQNLIARLPLMEEAGEDLMIWNETPSGYFSLKSAYYMIEKTPLQYFDSCYKSIWAWQGAENIRVFLWLAFNSRLPTNEWRSKWSPSSPTCSFCGNGDEDVLHILRDCYYVRQVWLSLIHTRYASTFFSCSLKDWMSYNLKEEIGKDSNMGWNLIWGVATWLLWNWRNKFIFCQDFHKPMYPTGIIRRSWKLYCIQPDANYMNELMNVARPVRWIPPPTDWVKLNIDGAVVTHDRKTGCGGVIRDHRGEWSVGFTQVLGQCGVYEAKEWAALLGLKIAWDEGFKKVMVESDSKILVEKLRHGRDDSTCSMVFLQLRRILQRD